MPEKLMALLLWLLQCGDIKREWNADKAEGKSGKRNSWTKERVVDVERGRTRWEASHWVCGSCPRRKKERLEWGQCQMHGDTCRDQHASRFSCRTSWWGMRTHDMSLRVRLCPWLRQCWDYSVRTIMTLHLIRILLSFCVSASHKHRREHEYAPFCDCLSQSTRHTLHHSAGLRCQNHLGDKESPLPPARDTVSFWGFFPI